MQPPLPDFPFLLQIFSLLILLITSISAQSTTCAGAPQCNNFTTNADVLISFNKTLSTVSTTIANETAPPITYTGISNFTFFSGPDNYIACNTNKTIDTTICLYLDFDGQNSTTTPIPGSLILARLGDLIKADCRVCGSVVLDNASIVPFPSPEDPSENGDVEPIVGPPPGTLIGSLVVDYVPNYPNPDTPRTTCEGYCQTGYAPGTSMPDSVLESDKNPPPGGSSGAGTGPNGNGTGV